MLTTRKERDDGIEPSPQVGENLAAHQPPGAGDEAREIVNIFFLKMERHGRMVEAAEQRASSPNTGFKIFVRGVDCLRAPNSACRSANLIYAVLCSFI